MAAKIKRANLRAAAGGMIAGWLLVCAGGCGGVIVSPAPEAAPNSSEPAAATPAKPIKLVAEGGDTYNFGTVELGEEIEHTFVIRNAGEEQVKIFAGKPSCEGCPEFKLDKFDLPPNETVNAKVKWKILADAATFNHRSPIYATSFAAQPKPELILHVEGKVHKRIVVSPSIERWSVGITKEGVPTEFEATVVSPTLENFQIESITTTNPAVTVTASPFAKERLQEVQGRSGYVLKTVIAPDIPIGDFNEHVQLKLLVPDPVTINVNVTARRSGPVQIFGSNWYDNLGLISMGSFSPKQGRTEKLALFTKGVNEVLRIEKVICADDRFTVELTPDPKYEVGTGERRKYDLVVKVAPDDRSIVYSPNAPLEIALQTSHSLVGTLKLKVRCSALAQN